MLFLDFIIIEICPLSFLDTFSPKYNKIIQIQIWEIMTIKTKQNDSLMSCLEGKANNKNE